MITRRTLLGFVAFGGFLASLHRRLFPSPRENEAMFWEQHRGTVSDDTKEELDHE